MRWRVPVAVILALVAGVAGGWAYASAQDDDQDTGPVAAVIKPVKATPSLPVVVAQPDPDDDTLETDIKLDPETLQLPPEGDPVYQVDLPVPRGWDARFDGKNKWTYTVPDNDPKSYLLRVQIIAGEGDRMDAAVRSRISALRSAVAQGGLSDLDYQEFPTEDGFTATYVDHGYDRVSIEQFYAGPDGKAFATVATIGRFRDRNGLEDLLARISIDLRTQEL